MIFDYALMPTELPSTVGFEIKYFNERNIRLDCRGPLVIHPDSRWGHYVTVITKSHNMGPDGGGYLVDRPVIVDKNAWICSGAYLYNCHIGEGAVVSVGTVVRSQEVKPFVMVAGNPARVIARYINGEWVYAKPKYEVLS